MCYFGKKAILKWHAVIIVVVVDIVKSFCLEMLKSFALSIKSDVAEIERVKLQIAVQ